MDPSEIISNPADLIETAIERAQVPLIAGIDPDINRFPESLMPKIITPSSVSLAIKKYFEELLPPLSENVAGVKFQSACFEKWGSCGFSVMGELIALAKKLKLLVILDHKRGDISISARHYAASAMYFNAGWATVSPWLGSEAITPYLDLNIGAFVLVRTSNSTSAEIQKLKLESGDTISEALAKMVTNWGSKTVGECGYSAIGAVVGATHPDEFVAYRELMPNAIFLLPGIGAQGGKVQDLSPCFDKKGRGALVTSSRSIIYPAKTSKSWIQNSCNAAMAIADELEKIGATR